MSKNRAAVTSEEQTWRSIHTLKLLSLGWDASLYSLHFTDMPSPHRVSTHIWGCKSFGCQCVVDGELQ